MTLPTMEAKVRMLLDVLDEDIRHVETVLVRLDALRALLVKRDDGGLEKLLEEIHRQAETYADNEQKRQGLRRDLAVQLGCRESDLTLSRLREQISGHNRTAIEERQARLKSLVEQLKREHKLTTLLIADCTRFNRSLMRALFGAGDKGSMTYGPSGAAKHQAGTTLMSLQL
jgi:flagellar biosynthesis/type III secretory pathway chaperone